MTNFFFPRFQYTSKIKIQFVSKGSKLLLTQYVQNKNSFSALQRKMAVTSLSDALSNMQNKYSQLK